MKTTVGVQLGQRAGITPQLVQQIRLLSLSGVEIEQEVAQWMATNVMLEQYEAAELDDAEEAEAADGEREVIDEELALDSNWDDVNVPMACGCRGEDDGDERPVAAAENVDPVACLLRELPVEARNARELAAAMAILDAVDERGWLDVSLREIAARSGIDEGCLLSALALIRRLAPAGFAATDLAECFTLQLECMPESNARDTALAIVAEGIERLARRELEAVRRAVRATPEAFAEALSLLRRLDPHPGRARVSAQMVVPDVVVRRRDGRWTVELSAAATPRVRINAGYAQVVDGLGREGAAMRQQLNEARWLLKGLEMRADTLLRVAHAIFARQFAFLAGGDEALHPLTLREIAEQVGVHESTVSRVTTAKYVDTPRGLFELKHFFGSGLAGTDANACNTAARAWVRRLIEQEPRSAPLDDGAIAAHLAGQGIRIARRTVAKYREGFGIPPARLRGAARIALAG
jgi:RNA polymerase sigma-54 factor